MGLGLAEERNEWQQAGARQPLKPGELPAQGKTLSARQSFTESRHY